MIGLATTYLLTHLNTQGRGRLKVLINWAMVRKYPSGTYTLSHKGKGKFKFFGAGFTSIESEKPDEIQINLNSSAGGIIIEITEIDTKDYLRDIKFIFPGGFAKIT